MNQFERMDAGLIYNPNSKEILEEQTKRLELLYDFNQTRPSDFEKRRELMEKMFASVGKNCYIEPPFHANWAGKNIYIGDYVYANFNLTLVDDGKITIGNYVMFGPNVTVATPNHPILPEFREKGYQYNKEVLIGNNVWIGANTVIVPGVSIGDNSVIGAGSVVTHDVPSNVVAYGNPCRVAREISEHDRIYFYKNEKIDWENLK